MEREKISFLAEKLRKVHVTESTYERFKNYQQDEEKMENIMVIREYPADMAKELKEEHDLDSESAALLASGKGERRIILLAEDPTIRQLAEDLNVGSMDYEELMDKYEEKQEEAGQE